MAVAIYVVNVHIITTYEINRTRGIMIDVTQILVSIDILKILEDTWRILQFREGEGGW
jgi:hypothetical protein